MDNVPTTQAPTAETKHQQRLRQIDQLIPRRRSAASKMLVGGTLLLAALTFAVLNQGGYLTPSPLDHGSSSSDIALQYDEARDAVGAQVVIPNRSQRMVRVTDIDFDAPGAELVDAVFRHGDDDAGPFLPLPATIEAGERIVVQLWFVPVTCEEVSQPWGVAVPTFDFGEGAFPPFASTQRVADDPVWDLGASQSTIRVGDEFTSGRDPIAVACEVLG